MCYFMFCVNAGSFILSLEVTERRHPVDKSFAYVLNDSLNFTFEHQLSVGKGSY